MAIHRITAAHDPAIQLEFELPIKGRQNPLFFTVPKMQYMPLPKAEEFRDWLTNKGKEDQSMMEHPGRQVILKMLELTVSAKEYAILEKLTDGELLEIELVWNAQSKVEVGESSASSDT